MSLSPAGSHPPWRGAKGGENWGVVKAKARSPPQPVTCSLLQSSLLPLPTGILGWDRAPPPACHPRALLSFPLSCCPAPCLSKSGVWPGPQGMGGPQSTADLGWETLKCPAK
ncbi:heparan sulfate glucosamine 3-O-sulfotransferase 4 [Platysternon megacephalum]|uniref:Heparan sulfate glucosamine 3-O-sulfotransferase 4 n=1 Tax=Platysternon megacephalum TaxID=55544 RepID=A0A4D9EJJ0_9SAUR|nr:heparan sulfate glucosamine 3-O-sulfotransferase 4 [Platysternon megacephalum]